MLRPMLASQWVISPVEPAEAMNRKASGTPPKLANTPEAVIATCRRTFPRLAVKIAYAISSPKMAGRIEVNTDSSMLCLKPLR